MKGTAIYPKIQAILAAVLFGASSPLAKLLLNDISPVLLAALLYLGCGFGLFIFRYFQNQIAGLASKEAGLTTLDVPWLIGAILCGGVAAPISLMFSLKATPAATASLLLNFEGVATSIIAVFIFKEALGKRVWSAIALIALASIILTWDPNETWGVSWGAIGVILTCICWGLDNNLTRNISAKDPLEIVAIKGITAGTVSLCIAMLIGCSIPKLTAVVAAALLGFISYGLSTILFILAMRSLGAARTSGFFGAAPFAGTLISLLLFRELPGIMFLISLPFMIVGTILILREDHSHLHRHTRVEHEHRHSHNDGHHNHQHEENCTEFHSHRHVHEEIKHSHPHTPDIHHRHMH
ncbi:MAG: EamA family transporter [Methylocystaceae bacterium]